MLIELPDGTLVEESISDKATQALKDLSQYNKESLTQIELEILIDGGNDY